MIPRFSPPSRILHTVSDNCFIYCDQNCSTVHSIPLNYLHCCVLVEWFVWESDCFVGFIQRWLHDDRLTDLCWRFNILPFIYSLRRSVHCR